MADTCDGCGTSIGGRRYGVRMRDGRLLCTTCYVKTPAGQAVLARIREKIAKAEN